MSYNVQLSPVQVISAGGGGGAQSIDFGPAFLPGPLRQVPFFIAIHKTTGTAVYLVRIGETSSGLHAAAGEDIVAGPFTLDNADGVLELFFTAAGDADVSFLSVLSEGV